MISLSLIAQAQFDHDRPQPRVAKRLSGTLENLPFQSVDVEFQTGGKRRLELTNEIIDRENRPFLAQMC